VGHRELTKRELEVLQYIAIAAKRGADRSEYLKKRTSPGLDLGDRKILGPNLPADGGGRASSRAIVYLQVYQVHHSLG
jgi:hypothetical protein